MLSHDFISVSEENITSALNYYPNMKLTGKETRIVKIKDKIILKYITIFNDVDIFIKLSGQSINRLNYYGCSVIPPSSCLVLYNKIRKTTLFKGIKLWKLSKILRYSISNNYYIVHHGI